MNDKHNEEVSRSVVTINRLKKRIAKLTRQRDHFKETTENYRAVLDLHPYLEKKFTSYTDLKAERERVRQLEVRVQEQAALISFMTKNK